MTKQEQLDRLDHLKANPDTWDFDRDAQTYTAVVDDYTLKVVKKAGQCEWSVLHVSYGTLMEPVPAIVAAWAKAEAIDYTRAHILGATEPQHAE